VQREIQESAYRWQQAVDRGAKVVVGVNRFRSDEALELDILRVDPAVGRRQADRLRALRQRRDDKKVSDSLTRLRAAAKTDDNLMPLIVDAVEQYATLGEICGVLRDAFGEYQASTVF
jgi:methylmalonyl-CoA mutase N-terminal domain/subunit